MEVTAVLLRWYRSFNVRTLGPADSAPAEHWHNFRGQLFPFVRVPLDGLITTIVGANESGKSHLLSAIAKVINGTGHLGSRPDPYEIKDICRYCGFDGLDESVWPEIGLELKIEQADLDAFGHAENGDNKTHQDSIATDEAHTVLLNGGKVEDFAVVYRGSAVWKKFNKEEWRAFAKKHLPEVAILDSELALPNEVHVDALIDLYEGRVPQGIVDPLAVQDLWRVMEPIEIIPNAAPDAASVKHIKELKASIAASVWTAVKHESALVLQLFGGVLEVPLASLKQIREYSNSERGYVERLLSEINCRIERELDISRYWDQDEDFKLTVSYKSGMFHFQITDRTGVTYTFNERSSGLRFFLSYYIQAKALEKANNKRGVVILMDEPDSFLSASGQRSLLRVFDALVSHKTAQAPCQLVYTTHSPFLINRNFPNRIRLVRKGDGAEGTQYVERAAVRRFEPVRSALSIDSADTLFLGSINVIVEGQSDQKLLTACVQRFGAPGKLEHVLDLNSVTLVSADGAPYAAQLVQKAMRGDEKPPIVVVLLDGDDAGCSAATEVAKHIDQKQVCTFREVEAPGKVFQVLEDLVPDTILDEAVRRYLERRSIQCRAAFDGSTTDENNAKRLGVFCKNNCPELAGMKDVEIRGGIIDILVECLGDPAFQPTEMDLLRSAVERVCARLNQMIEQAYRCANRYSLKKLARQQIDTFVKRFPRAASKGDVKKLLADMAHIASGRSEDAEGTKKNLDLLGDQLEKEAALNSDPVSLEIWKERLGRLKNDPWAVVKDWSTIPLPRRSARAPVMQTSESARMSAAAVTGHN